MKMDAILKEVVNFNPTSGIKQFTSVKGRVLKPGQEVFVYFNLHKKVFSVKDVKTGLVVAHTPFIQLAECEFKVSEAGRQRVLSSGHKNVHAGIKGKYAPHYLELDWNQATYNPKKYRHFVDCTTKVELSKADFVFLSDKKVYYHA